MQLFTYQLQTKRTEQTCVRQKVQFQIQIHFLQMNILFFQLVLLYFVLYSLFFFLIKKTQMNYIAHHSKFRTNFHTFGFPVTLKMHERFWLFFSSYLSFFVFVVIGAGPVFIEQRSHCSFSHCDSHTLFAIEIFVTHNCCGLQRRPLRSIQIFVWTTSFGCACA